MLPTEIVETRPHVATAIGCVRSPRTSAQVVLLDDSGTVLVLCSRNQVGDGAFFQDGAAPKVVIHRRGAAR